LLGVQAPGETGMKRKGLHEPTRNKGKERLVEGIGKRGPALQARGG
jgi:hypothetical protein